MSYADIDLAESIVGLGFAIKRFLGLWSFKAVTPEQAYPYGPFIQIDGPDHHLPEDIREGLKKLVLWGGNSSNNPAEYSHWEFPSDGVHWWRAVNFLKEKGWAQK